MGSRTGIEGNVLADAAANEATAFRSIVRVPLVFGDFRSLVRSFVFRQWQESWTLYGRCRLKSFKPVLGDWKSAYRENRREEKILSRHRTGSCLFLARHFFIPFREWKFAPRVRWS